MACWGPRPSANVEDGVVWPPDGEVAALSAGDPLCALRPDGSLACSRTVWGEDDEPTPGGAFVAVSVGYEYACGIRPRLALECWGSNLIEDLRGDVIAGYVDVGKARPPEGAFVAVSTGYGHACGIGVGGGVVCWGSNRHKQLVGIPEGRFVAVAVGYESACALRPDGSAVCWGGAGREVEESTPGGRFVAISERDGGYCGLRPDGNIDCWWPRSGNWKFCLWLVLSRSPFEPHYCTVAFATSGPTHGAVRVLGPGGEYVALSARKGYTCGLLDDGAARCWGLFFSGEAQPPPGPFTQISAGWFHACGLRPGGEIDCWGDREAPPPAPPGGVFTAVSAGWGYTCGLRPDGAVECWDRQPGCAPWALVGRTGDDPAHPTVCWDRADSPGAGGPAGTFEAVAAGAGHACALRATDGAAVCWGDNRHAQTDAPAGEFRALSAGFAHTCGLRPDGAAACWGNNKVAQADPPPGAFTAVAAGEWHTCALRASGEAACWGDDRAARERWRAADWGELVTEWAYRMSAAWTDARPTPPPGPFTAIAAGNFHTCAIRSDHSVDCWGH